MHAKLNNLILIQNEIETTAWIAAYYMLCIRLLYFQFIIRYWIAWVRNVGIQNGFESISLFENIIGLFIVVSVIINID